MPSRKILIRTALGALVAGVVARVLIHRRTVALASRSERPRGGRPFPSTDPGRAMVVTPLEHLEGSSGGS